MDQTADGDITLIRRRPGSKWPVKHILRSQWIDGLGADSVLPQAALVGVLSAQSACYRGSFV